MLMGREVGRADEWREGRGGGKGRRGEGRERRYIHFVREAIKSFEIRCTCVCRTCMHRSRPSSAPESVSVGEMMMVR